MSEEIGVITHTEFGPSLVTLLKYLKREKINPVLITYGQKNFPSPNATYIEEILRKEDIVREHVRAVKLKIGYSTSLIDILSKSVEFAFEHLTEFTKIFEQKQDPLWEWASKPIQGPKVRAADEVNRAVYDLR